VLWLTLRAVNKQYELINEVIHGASARFRWMKVVDWNAYARNRPLWFATDGIHLSAQGGVQLAILIHRTLQQMGLAGRLPAPSS
jgi:lysophospholipase L1-like esterase